MRKYTEPITTNTVSKGMEEGTETGRLVVKRNLILKCNMIAVHSQVFLV
jgi:hypothetical protein